MNQKGQTSVEYILIIAVVVTITMSLFEQIKENFIGDEGVMSRYLQAMGSNFDGQYRYFTLRR